MSIFPNKRLITAVAVPVMLVCTAPVTLAAEKPDTTKPTETRQTQQKGAKAPARKPAKSVFKPKEKVSAGKPVSFPSDI